MTKPGISAVSDREPEAGAPENDATSLRVELESFLDWLADERGLYLCAVGYGGEMVEVGLVERHIDDYVPASQSHAARRPSGDREAQRTPDQGGLKSAFERMDRIHSEFERCVGLGLPPPSLRDLDRLFGRVPDAGGQ